MEDYHAEIVNLSMKNKKLLKKYAMLECNDTSIADRN